MRAGHFVRGFWGDSSEEGRQWTRKHCFNCCRMVVLPSFRWAVASVITLTILFERMWRYRGLESQTRAVTRETIESLVRRDVDGARSGCEKSEAPVAKIFLEAMRWKNIAIEDLDRVLLTARQEAVTDLKRGLWVIGTIGSLAPYVGLFGTVSRNHPRVSGAWRSKASAVSRSWPPVFRKRWLQLPRGSSSQSLR